ncbi:MULTISPECIES: magnesium transporter MgtE N-terminal domain-containing protein [unclassified Phycicoccus]|uniref:magnesium transporter MgtE N-terminal domain-containing protein n=1 Tax=unclassified Phycicoccus TaxID=2637926 RepID=UPI00070304B0|nr:MULTISPECIES: CBS domain-containing protein [unclassified Phycicoccus]KQU70831.1 magnesium transporter [Phycicoccus sp. Root101]KQZ89121.1 magnesium transporter [Phycicoccus sp. Root563]
MSTPSRVFVGRLTSLSVFDPLGDQVGRVRDVVVTFGASRRRPRVIGLVVEVPGRRRVFVPMTRVTSVDGGQVITTGLVNMRRFEQRTNEVLVMAEILERPVTVADPEGAYSATVEDVAIERERSRDWSISKVFVRQGGSSRTAIGPFRRRRGATVLVPVEDVTGIHQSSSSQSAALLLETYDDLKSADLADVIHDLSPKRRAEVAEAMDDDKLADVLEELPEDDQVEILDSLPVERAADVLEAMEPDDATDLLHNLTTEKQEELLQLMEPDEAADLRRLLTYDEESAGGMMTTEPVILGPEASIAEALAVVRRVELSPALAATIYVCRAPHETPSGKYLGMVHIQRLLREPPHGSIGSILDKEIEPLTAEAPLGQVTRMLATYNLVGVPVVDEDGRLVGAVTVDDVLDHILPDDWREERHEVTRG